MKGRGERVRVTVCTWDGAVEHRSTAIRGTVCIDRCALSLP